MKHIHQKAVNKDTTMTEQQWIEAWEDWAQLTPTQRVELVHAAFNNEDEVPF